MHRTTAVLFFGLTSALAAQTPPAQLPALSRIQATPVIAGRWNLTVQGPRGPQTAWLEIERSGFRSLVGRFVGRIGGVRPIGRIDLTGDVARFAIPAQWEPGDELRFEVRSQGEGIAGTITWSSGQTLPFTGRRAPSLNRPIPTRWSAPVALFNGRDLAGWTPAGGTGRNSWSVRDGVLINTQAEGANLRTDATFQDFRLHAEFRYPANGDGGVFLRGRYEVQINDDPERDSPTVRTSGGIYSFLVPTTNAATAAGAWQSFDITLVGRRVTVILNGTTVIADQLIPGPSGSALDVDEASPGPIMLQGEESAIEFRNITIAVPQPGTDARSEVAARSCAATDVDAASAVRARLGEWVRQANAGDAAAMREVWASDLVGWFPRAALFTDSAAIAVAGATPGASSTVRYALTIDDVSASGPLVAVHDLWTETRSFARNATVVERTIRSSELWRCQPDGRWRIVRYVSAPEPWRAAGRGGT